jgi:hypothetical protein
MILGQVKSDPSCQYHGGTGPSPYQNEGAISGQSGHGPGPSGRPGSGAHGQKGTSGKPGASACGLGGGARHGLGKAHLGQARARVLTALAAPARRAHGFLHFCNLAVHFGRGGRADFIDTVSKSFHAGKARVGASMRTARAALHGERVLAHHGSDYVLTVNHRGWRLLVGVRRGRVNWLAAASSRLSIRQLGGLLIASGR